MPPGDAKTEDRIGAGLMAGATLAALMLMMHHPTALDGPDDGLLLGDWSNRAVHGGMTACLFALAFAGPIVARRLDERRLSVRAGRMAYAGGMTALIGAALVNGFVLDRIARTTPDADTARALIHAFGATNQVLGVLGVCLAAVATALWAIRMVRLDAAAKAAAGLGVLMAGMAAWWLLFRDGVFGLYPATIAMVLFAAWSLLVAAWLIRGADRNEGSKSGPTAGDAS